MTNASISQAANPPGAAAAKYTEEPVIWIHRWNPGLMSLRVKRDPGYVFNPGQFARIGIRKDNGDIIWRAYSIVSAPHERFLEFFLVVLPNGEFSSRVGKFAVGDSLLVEHMPQGFLTIDRFKQPGREQDLWLISTGTGLAPYISMMRDATACWRFENIVLVLSVRERHDLGYIDELERLAATYTEEHVAKFHFVITVTRETLPNALHGRITTLLESGALESAAGVALSTDRSRFMLCGNPDMVEGMRALLKARGFRMNRRLEPGHIIVENYW
ncbi:MAG: ferredoxin--NADP reductase [Betaproteobacteria bacterium]